MKIYIITDKLGGERYYYTSIPAAIMDPECPLDLSFKQWKEKVGERGGYPFEHEGIIVDLDEAKTLKDVYSENAWTDDFETWKKKIEKDAEGS